jgi:hypothetical protein
MIQVFRLLHFAHKKVELKLPFVFFLSTCTIHQVGSTHLEHYMVINYSYLLILIPRNKKCYMHARNNATMEKCGYSHAKRTHLCQGTSVVNSSHDHGNVFSSDMDLTEVSAIAYGTRRLTKLSEVRTWSSTSSRCTRLLIARSNYGVALFHACGRKGRDHGGPRPRNVKERERERREALRMWTQRSDETQIV